MNPGPDRRPDPDLQDRIRNLPRPVPDPAFREEARRRFLEGIPSPVRPSSGRGSRKPWIWSAGGLAAAAALVVVLLLLSTGPAWRITEVVAAGPVLIDGQPMTVEECTGLRLVNGTRVRGCEQGEMELLVEDAVRLVVGPGAEVTVGSTPRFPGRRRLTAAVHRGTAFGTTGSGFPASGLRIETPEALVQVSGTTFAVACDPDTTCVCVLAGKVVVTAKDTGERIRVPGDQQLFVPAAGTPRFLALTPEQRDRLVEIRDRGAR